MSHRSSRPAYRPIDHGVTGNTQKD